MFRLLGTAMVVAFMLLIQACAPKEQADCGFVQNAYGERVSWKSDVPVVMHIHESVPDQMIPAIVAAAKTWDKTIGRPIFQIVTSPKVTGPADPHKDGMNIIYLLNSWEANRSTEQGRTSVYWVGDLIKEADIRLNSNDFGFYWQSQSLTKSIVNTATQVNIEALVLHEMGHVLGLKHKDGAGSVMATYLANGDDRVQLAETDKGSLKCEY